MKKMKLFILTTLVFFIHLNVANAICNATESNRLNSIAVKVNASYEEMEGVLDPSEYTPPDGITPEEAEKYEAKYNYFRIYITNLTEDLYVTVYNDDTKETKRYTYEDSKNGTISFDWKYIRDLVNYTITVYSSNKTECPDTKLHTTYLTTPRFNEYSTLKLCDGAEDFYLCFKYSTANNEDFDKFTELVTKYKEGKVDNTGNDVEKPQTEEKGLKDFIKEHKTAVIIATIAVLIAGGTITVIVVKFRRVKSEK